MFAGQQSQQAVAAAAAVICRTLRDNLDDAQNFYAWLSAQADTDLAALGFSSQDIVFLRSAFNDLMALATVVHGGALPNTYVLPYDFTVNVKEIVGP